MRVSVKNKPCLICGSRTNKGVFFGVDCCRACSAFYRRSIENKKVFKCQRGAKKCDLTIKVKGTPICRYCRLEKCKRLGMQIDRETSETPSTSSPQNSTPKPSSSLQSSPEPSNVYGLIFEKVKNIFHQPFCTTMTFNMPLLKNLNYCFTEFSQKMLPCQPVIVSNVFDKNSYADFQGKFMIELANMLMQCKEFTELSLNDKLLLYQHTKAIFSNIERQYSSIQYFGDSMEDYRVLHDDTRAFDYGLETVETNDTDNEKFVKALPLFIKIRDKFISLITKPMKALKITQFEMVYILFQILWTVESNSELSMEAIKVAEKVSDKIADEIHTYYKCELRVHNYAPRLLKLHQLIDGSKAVESTKAETFIISQVYNIYDFQVSPEHFGVIH